MAKTTILLFLFTSFIKKETNLFFILFSSFNQIFTKRIIAAAAHPNLSSDTMQDIKKYFFELI